MVLLGCVLACSYSQPSIQPTSAPVDPAPLAEERTEQLRKILTGSWEFVETRTTPEQASGAKRTGGMTVWTFEEDGSFRYEKRTQFPEVVAGQWKLDGRNLVLDPSGVTGTVTYRLDEWTTGRMIWFNYDSRTYYVLDRVGLMQVHAWPEATQDFSLRHGSSI